MDDSTGIRDALELSTVQITAGDQVKLRYEQCFSVGTLDKGFVIVVPPFSTYTPKTFENYSKRFQAILGYAHERRCRYIVLSPYIEPHPKW